MSRPNVVLICVDEWRGDCLGADGHPYVQTPHLDELARSGTRFRHGYSATPTCAPARVALFTGQSQEAHGRVGYTDGTPFNVAHPVTMQGEFRNAGYQTQAIGKMHVYPERTRAGFDEVILHDGFLHFSRRAHRRHFELFDDYVPWLRRQPGATTDEDYFDHGVHCNSLVARPWDKPEAQHPTNWIAGQTGEWLYRRDPTRPFFLYLSFHRPHPPYDPPAWAFEQYLNLPQYEPVTGNWEHHWDAQRADYAHNAFFGAMDPAVVHRARAGYYGLMTQLDHQINRIRETLGDFDLLQDTVIAFTADHGDMMGDHHMFRKGYGYEGSARIPFIVSGAPAQSDLVRGQVVDNVVELRDVMPTLLQLADIPVPETCDGRSLVSLLRGERPEWRKWLHGEHTLFGQSLQWVTDGDIKYCWRSGDGAEELFDLREDPGERRNLAEEGNHRDLLTLWRGRLIESLRGREEGYVSGDSLVPGREPILILRHTRERIEAAS